MLIACWSVKGGSGTTVVAASLALLLARSNHGGAVLADLDGDGPAVLGLAEPAGPGLRDWMAAGPGVAPEALDRIAVPVDDRLTLLPRGRGEPGRPDDGERLAAALVGPRPVVVDCGSALGRDGAASIAAAADLSLLVLRPCYLALRRAVAAPFRPSGVVLVREDDRALTAADVADALGVPVRAEVRAEGAIARAIDAGLLARRMPRELQRALGRSVAGAAAA